MIPLTTHYDEYIDRPKLPDKKPIWVYSSYPLKRGRNNKINESQFLEVY